jgi:uncharacterized protein DUF5996
MSDYWPALPLEEWRDTYATVHMWSQIVGKICLKLAPPTNHYWGIAFHLDARGFMTPLLPYEDRAFAIRFNFIDRQLEILCSDGGLRHIALGPMTVVDFYHQLMHELHEMGIVVKIWTMPVEIPDPIRFTEDTVHHAYDADQAEAFWRALVAIKPVFEGFRCGFLGKCSPVHFFWGSFDLAVTRFSGRRAPAQPEKGAMYAEAYSHEVISHGFWPGSGPVQEAAFYAYSVPAPSGFQSASVLPGAAYFHQELGEFILPYEAVRTAASPERELRSFLESTYSAAADLADWNRAELERGPRRISDDGGYGG